MGDWMHGSLLVVVMVSACTAADVEGGKRWLTDVNKIRCNTTLATDGTTAAVSCHYPWNIKEELLDFNVVRLKCNSTDIDEVPLLCSWIVPERPVCSVAPEYYFNYRVSNQITLQVPPHTLKDGNQFRCQVIPPRNESDPCGGENKPCKEQVISKQLPPLAGPNEPGDNRTPHPDSQENDGMTTDVKIAVAACLSAVALAIGIIAAVLYLKSFMKTIHQNQMDFLQKHRLRAQSVTRTLSNTTDDGAHDTRGHERNSHTYNRVPSDEAQVDIEQGQADSRT